MKYKIINRRKLFAVTISDIFGYVLFSPLKILRKSPRIEKNINKILIIRTAYVGDILMTLPILRPLKEKFPHARITFIASKDGAGLLRGNPYIDRILPFNPFWFYKASIKDYISLISKVRSEQFDLAIEARGDIRELFFIVLFLRARLKLSYGFGGGAYLLTNVVPFTGMKHRIEYHLDLIRSLGCTTDAIDWGIYLEDSERKKVKEILKANGIKKPFISVHPGARLPLKRWSVEGYAGLGDMIAKELGITLVMFGSEHERELVNRIVDKMRCKPIVLAGRLTLRELAGFFAESALLICNDSAPMHIAAAMKTPTIGIFGPSKSQETAPYGSNCRVVEKDFPCRLSCDETKCRNKDYHGCMKAIYPHDVFNAIKELIA
jgi:predicted lipopolysaccharide heptosyltransferase III